MDDRFIRRIATSDEIWGYCLSPDASKQWLCPRQPVKVIVKYRFGPRVMCVWWNFEGVIHCEFVSNGGVVDADVYSQQLERVDEILGRRYPALTTRKNTSLTAGQCETPYCMNNYDKNSRTRRNQSATTPSIQP